MRLYVQDHFDAEPDRRALYEARMRLEADPSRAIQELKWLASRGSVMSMIYVGEAHAFGKGIAVDLAEATKWYQMAADAGSAVAEHALARLYMKTGDDDRIVNVLKSAAAKDYAPAIYLLGRFYFWGRGVERDPAKGAELFERAMRLGSLPAKGAMAKYLMTSHLGFTSFVRGLWLGLCVRVQVIYFLLAEGTRSERLRF